jgi:tetratricopeptide (TPR) repeat protein
MRNTYVRPRAALGAVLCLCLALPVLAAAQENGANAHGDSGFEFPHVTPGEYTLRVVAPEGETICERQASVGQWQTEIDVRVPDPPVNRPSGAAGTVSVKQLLHPPSKKAYRSFAAARKFTASGDYSRATAALERAVAESPDYAEAHINLGVQYIRAGRYPQAEAEFRRATDIAGASAPALCNLAWVQAGWDSASARSKACARDCAWTRARRRGI